MRGQVRPGPAAKMAAANSAKKERQAEKKKAAKSFLKGKADKVAGKDQAKPPVKEEGNTKKVVEAKASRKEKKEAVLAEARKKIGASEEKRKEFKERTKQSQAKRQAKRQEAKQQTQAAATIPAATTPATTTPAATTPAVTATAPNAMPAATTGDATLGRLKRKDMDPNRSVMAQRVEHQMKKTGMTREDAKAAVVARREARQAQIADIQSQYGVGAGQARNIVQYANRNKVAGAEGQPAVANYQLAKRVVQMAKNKGLSRSEAAGVIASRKEKRQAAAAPAQTPTT